MTETTGVHLSASARLVAEALGEVKECTVRALADSARVSKSSVAKTLALLERSGAAIRTVREDCGVREADLWSPGPSLGALLFTAVADAPGYGHAEMLAAATETFVGLYRPDASADGDVAGELDGRTTTPQGPGSVAAEGPVPPPSSESGVGTVSGIEPKRVPEVVPLADPVASGAVMKAPSTPAESALGGRAGRLAAGELATMVANMLAAHPGIEYTPTMLSHLLGGRSSGAIHNVLEKMIKVGAAVRTCDKPKRYRDATEQVSDGC